MIEPIKTVQMIKGSLGGVLTRGSGLYQKGPVACLREQQLSRQLLQDTIREL